MGPLKGWGTRIRSASPQGGCFGGRTLTGSVRNQTLLVVRERKAMGSGQRPELLETHLVDECVQHPNRAAQISDALIQRLNLLLELRDTLVVRDHHFQFLTTILPSAYTSDF